jgi:hypothetical protein
MSGKAERESADPPIVFGPGEGLPDAEGFFADRRTVLHPRRIKAQ